jgi:hypothetical protein
MGKEFNDTHLLIDQSSTVNTSGGSLPGVVEARGLGPCGSSVRVVLKIEKDAVSALGGSTSALGRCPNEKLKADSECVERAASCGRP